MRRENMIPSAKFSEVDVVKIKYRNEIIKRLRAYDTTCPESSTLDTGKLLRLLGAMYGECVKQNWCNDTEQEYQEIVARLKRYDRICHNLKQLIATLSSGVDK